MGYIRDKPHFVSSFYSSLYLNLLTTLKPPNMPLVVPGINSSFGDKSEWVNKLMGKKISDISNETVRHLY